MYLELNKYLFFFLQQHGINCERVELEPDYAYNISG